MKVSGLKISDKTSATLELISRGNPISDLDDHFNLSNTALERLKGSIIKDGVSTEIELSKNGIFTYSEPFHDQILALISKYKSLSTVQPPNK